MLTDRVSLETRLAGCRFLFFALVLFTSGIPVQSLFPVAAEQEVVFQADASKGGLPSTDQVTAPPVEICDLFNAAPDLQIESVFAETQFWSSATAPSPGTNPSGLVLSYLCDSARHQCCGVQLI